MQTELIFSQEGFPANPTPQPEKDLAKKMIDTSGRKCLESLEKFSQVGLWAKMFSALLIGQEGWYSTKCKLTWKLRGTKYSRLYCQLAVSTLRIEEIEFGLLPTPNASTGGGSDTNTTNARGKHSGNPLKTAANMGLLPTPIASDIHHAERVKALKETGAETMASRKNGANRPNGLMDYMDFNGMLPTPRASEWKGTGPIGSKSHKHMLDKDYLCAVVQQEYPTGQISQLSHHFVCEMMGFPINYLDLW